MKLNVLKEAVNGKRIIMIDDSIVRGTQLRETTEFLYQSGAKEVHVRPACPPLLYGCKYLNFSRSKSDMDLITRKVIQKLEGPDVSDEILQEYTDPSSEEIRDIIGADTLGYLKVERLHEMVEGLNICEGCFTGKYPLEPPKEDIRGDFER